MDRSITNIILGALTILSFIWAYLSEENRIIAIMFGFILVILIIISERNENIRIIEKSLQKLEEKLKIHEQLIDINADIKLLKERDKK